MVRDRGYIPSNYVKRQVSEIERYVLHQERLKMVSFSGDSFMIAYCVTLHKEQLLQSF